MYFKKSVLRAEGNPGIGIQPRDQVILIDTDDVLYMPRPDDAGVVIMEDIILKPNAYAFCLYMTPGTVEVTSAADGDTDKIGFQPSVKFDHPGNKREIREFKANCINKKFIVIIRYCSGQDSDLIGTICNACRMTPSYTGNSDGNTNEITFQQISKGDDIFIYKGSVKLERPEVEDPAIGGGELTYISDGFYVLGGETGEIELIEGGQPDSVITLYGDPNSADMHYTVKSASRTQGHILLRNGKDFVAMPGAQLTLRAFPVADGLVWIEQSRYMPA